MPIKVSISETCGPILDCSADEAPSEVVSLAEFRQLERGNETLLNRIAELERPDETNARWACDVISKLVTAIALCPGTKRCDRLMEAVADADEILQELGTEWGFARDDDSESPSPLADWDLYNKGYEAGKRWAERNAHCWHCGALLELVARPRCQDCPSECDIEGCDAFGCAPPKETE